MSLNRASCTSVFLFPIQTQQRVLASAFLRSLKDPFPPSRTAGLNGLAVTSSCYTPQDVANKILPGLSPTLVDPEKTVRDKARGTIYICLSACKRSACPLIVIHPVFLMVVGVWPICGTICIHL